MCLDKAQPALFSLSCLPLRPMFCYFINNSLHASKSARGCKANAEKPAPVAGCSQRRYRRCRMKAPRRKRTVALSLSSGSQVPGVCKPLWRTQPGTPRRKHGARRSRVFGRTREFSSQEKKSTTHACVCVCLSPGGCQGPGRCLPCLSTIPTHLKLGASMGLPVTREGLKHLLAGA